MSSPSAYAYLGIYGDFDPDEMAAEIGLEPSRSAAKHSRDPKKKIPRTSILRLGQTQANESGGVIDVYQLGDAVLTKLKEHKLKIVDAVSKRDVEVTFQVVLDFPISDDISTPVIGFSKEAVQFVAEIGALFDVDTYRS